VNGSPHPVVFRGGRAGRRSGRLKRGGLAAFSAGYRRHRWRYRLHPAPETVRHLGCATINGVYTGGVALSRPGEAVPAPVPRHPGRERKSNAIVVRGIFFRLW